MVEHLICNQDVEGSSPLFGSGGNTGSNPVVASTTGWNVREILGMSHVGWFQID